MYIYEESINKYPKQNDKHAKMVIGYLKWLKQDLIKDGHEKAGQKAQELINELK